MPWYKTEEEATEAAKEKTKEFGESFIVIKDTSEPNCYWAQRKSAYA